MRIFINEMNLYCRERFSLFPWGCIPFYIFFLAHGNTEHFQYRFLWILFPGILFFRIFDDFFCRSYDLRIGKSSAYLAIDKNSLGLFVILWGFVFSSAGLILLDYRIAIFICVFVGLNIVLYRVLRERKIIIYISLLKYPMFFFLIARVTHETNLFWPFAGSLLFIIRELIEEVWKKRNKKIEIILFLSLLGIKYINR